MKDKNWKEAVEQLGKIRHFSSLYVRKSRKGALTSAQEVDLLFRVALAKELLTPLQLSHQMGISKTAISRLIENLCKKELIEKRRKKEDLRSYVLKITEIGKKELDSTYYYYLEPLYKLKRNLGKEKFQILLKLIEEANEKM